MEYLNFRLAQIQDDDEDFYKSRSRSSRNRHRHDYDRLSNVGQLLPSNNVDRTNTAAEIAQQALQSIHAQKHRDFTRHQRRRNHSSSDYSSDSSSNQKKRIRSTKTSTELEQYATPDPSTFEWYPEIGYHFDKTTGFYFDAKSSYFYNPTTQKYMYWDPAKSTYISVDDTSTTATTTTVTNEITNINTGLSEPKEKVEKVKNAQKVAKEMEQWAKKEREKKEKEAKRKAQTIATTPVPAITNTSDSTSTSSSTIGTSSFAEAGLLSNRPTGSLISLNLMSTNIGSSTTNRLAPLAAFENPESDNDDIDNHDTMKSSTTTTTTTNALDSSEEKLIDWDKLACLLCQRQFDTRETLGKHLQMSNLHRENLAKAGIVRSKPFTYRDRAKERREKFGIDDSTKRIDFPSIRESSYSKSSRSISTSQNSSSGSIGSKLMKKHGWQEGHGLGKKLQGRADPLQAEIRQQGLGLGADQRLMYHPEPGDSYKDVVRKVARARFSMLES